MTRAQEVLVNMNSRYVGLSQEWLGDSLNLYTREYYGGETRVRFHVFYVLFSGYMFLKCEESSLLFSDKMLSASWRIYATEMNMGSLSTDDYERLLI